MMFAAFYHLFAAKTETDDEALKDEMAQQYKALQCQNIPGVASRDSLLRKKSSNKSLKRLFGRYLLAYLLELSYFGYFTNSTKLTDIERETELLFYLGYAEEL